MRTTRTWLTAMILIASTSLLAPVPGYAQNDNEKKKEDKQQKKEDKQQSKQQKETPPGQAKRGRAVSPQQPAQAQSAQQAQQQANRDRALQQQQAAQQQQAVQQQQAAQQQQDRNQRQAQQVQQRNQTTQRRTVVTRTAPQQRLPQRRQQQLITEQRQRTSQYATQLNLQTQLAQQRAAALQQQRRTNQYSFQQQYLQRLQQQQIVVRNAATYNYGNDPYFYTAPAYRYQRGGVDYQVNQYAADQLRQAVNLGYDQGFRAGRADRADGWRYDYQNSYAYQDANYGYQGLYVSQADYNYYFRLGISKGYDDGYYSRYQYGRQANGGVVILANVFQQILNLLPLR